ncbi:MAG: DUF2231 domain-containing protein [Cytophagaceae bacterium]
MSFIKDLQKGKLFGHPIHVMLIHFPMAMFPVGFIFDLLSWIKETPLFAIIGFYCMGIGLAGALLASIFGVMDFLRLPDDEIIRTKAVIHASVNMVVVFVYLGLFLFRMPHYETQKTVSPLLNALNGGLILGLIVSAHYGAELILRHKIGTIGGPEK